MYSETVTNPIREELKASGITELTDTESVHAFMKEKKGTAAVLINSVCGCAASTARPGFFYSLQHVHKPNHTASVFAGVDKEAVQTFREYLPGIPPSSPSLAFFREGKLVHFIGRNSFEGFDQKLITEVIGLVYDKFFGAAINENVELKDPLNLLERSPKVLQQHLVKKTTTLLDCRSQMEHEQGFIESSTLLEETLANEIVEKWDPQTDLTLYCTSGEISHRAALYFRQHGFSNVFILSGGYQAWQQYSHTAS